MGISFLPVFAALLVTVKGWSFPDPASDFEVTELPPARMPGYVAKKCQQPCSTNARCIDGKCVCKIGYEFDQRSKSCVFIDMCDLSLKTARLSYAMSNRPSLTALQAIDHVETLDLFNGQRKTSSSVMRPMQDVAIIKTVGTDKCIVVFSAIPIERVVLEKARKEANFWTTNKVDLGKVELDALTDWYAVRSQTLAKLQEYFLKGKCTAVTFTGAGSGGAVATLAVAELKEIQMPAMQAVTDMKSPDFNPNGMNVVTFGEPPVVSDYIASQLHGRVQKIRWVNENDPVPRYAARFFHNWGEGFQLSLLKDTPLLGFNVSVLKRKEPAWHSSDLGADEVPLMSDHEASEYVSHLSDMTMASRGMCHARVSQCYGNAGRVCVPPAFCNMVGDVKTCECPPFHTNVGGALGEARCVADDKCSVKGKPFCPENSTCTFISPGQAECSCKPGFKGPDGAHCVAVDLCAKENGGCDKLATCSQPTPATTVCTCNKGYRGNGAVCTTDPYLIRCANCSGDANCILMHKGVNCACNNGYTGDGQVCHPLPSQCSYDESLKCSPKQRCSKTATGAVCICKDGWEKAGNDCSAIQSCKINHGGCDQHAKCRVAAPGRNTCECNLGYRGDGTSCEPEKRCLHNNGGCNLVNAVCTDTAPGKSTCTCNPGYQGDGITCLSINLCERFLNGNCDAHAQCHPTGPAHSVCSCNSQYEGDGVTCRPIDYCSVDGKSTNDCSKNAQCLTSIGSYKCRCNTGFAGNGKQCVPTTRCAKDEIGCHPTRSRCIDFGGGKFGCACLNGFTGDGRTCAMIDACTESPCDVSATCISDGPGARKCKCRPGYHGNGEPHNCKWKDPCMTDNGRCNANAQCQALNTENVTCKCHFGFSGDGKMCEEINLCTKNNGGCHENAMCIHKGAGSRTCKCMIGFSGDGINNCELPGETFMGDAAGYALHFNGYSDFIRIDSASHLFDISGPNAYTIASWIRPSPWDCKGHETATVISRCSDEPGQSNCWYMGISCEGTPVFSRDVGFAFVYAQKKLPWNSWSHIAVSFKDGVAHVHVNGTESSAYSQMPLSGKQVMYPYRGGQSLPTIIGARYSPGKSLNSHFNGAIDELRLYSRRLQGPEFLRVMNYTCDESEDNLVACFKFNKGSSLQTDALSSNQSIIVAGSMGSGHIMNSPVWIRSTVPLQKLCSPVGSCSGHGACNSDTYKCDCKPNWDSTPQCNVYQCPSNCSGHGECKMDVGCVCSSGFTNLDCADRECPMGCSRQGKCNVDTGDCVCDEGFTGKDCSFSKCPNDCSDHGHCDTASGQCICSEHFTGEDCFYERCALNGGKECSGTGHCVNGSCVCNPHYSGEDCSDHADADCKFLADCNMHGECVDDPVNPKATGFCNCSAGFTGRRCEYKECIGGCSGVDHGQCNRHTGECICNPGVWGGDKCQINLICPNNCTSGGVKHGSCILGKCICDRGFCGVDCSTQICPNLCSGHGSCSVFGCDCHSGFKGKDCSINDQMPMRCTTVCKGGASRADSDQCVTNCNRGNSAEYVNLLGNMRLQASLGMKFKSEPKPKSV